MTRILLPTVILCLAAAIGRSAESADPRLENWHGWRGPLANGVAPNADPPTTWTETTNLKWKVPLPGEGSATPIVWNDRVFALAAVRTDRVVETLPPPKAEPPGGYLTKRPNNYYRFVVICFDRRTGKLLWQHVAAEAIPHEGRHATNTYASASPTTDGRRLYVSFGSRGVFAYDLDGTPLWQRDLGDMVTRFGWGEATSPVVHDGRLIVNGDHEGDSFLVVLDAATGETLWRADRDEVTSWATPLVVPHAGRTQLITPATRRITSYDLDTGEILWECGGLTTNVIPCPVVYGELVICISGHGRSAGCAVPLDAQGDVTGTDRIAWRLDRGTPYVPSPLLYGDLLYFTQSNRAILTCLDPRSGEPLAEGVRLPELKSLYASPVGAAGRVYFTSREGTTLVIKNQAELDVVEVNRLDDGIDASPALVDREIFLRSQRHLYCIAEQ